MAPRYVWVDEDEHNVLCSSLDIADFFTERTSEPQAWRTFWATGASPQGELKRYCARGSGRSQELGNIEIWVTDTDGRTIGSYFVGGATAKECRPVSGSTDPALVDIEITGLLLGQPHPQAGSIWERWRAGPPRARNIWAEYSTHGREGWLEVVRLYAKWDSRRIGDAPAGRTVDLDGEHITDPPSLYCALGEAVNGPGGYFGASLDGLRDCLRGGFGATTPFTIAWHSIHVARRSLGDYHVDPNAMESYFDMTLRILREAQVTVDFR